MPAKITKKNIMASASRRNLFDKGSVIIYRRGGGILGGITWFWGEQKGRSVVTKNPKGGITENFRGIQRGDHSTVAKVIKSY